MQKKNQLLVTKLNDVYDGNPWYGDSLKSILKNISPKIVLKKMEPYSHNIAELFIHIISWREFTLSRLQGDKDFNINQEESFNWKRIDSNEKTLWDSLLDALDRNQNEIVKKLENSNDDFLYTLVAGKNYNMEFLIEGIIQHDIYHVGQITLLNKLLQS